MGFSGGADSTALLALMKVLSMRKGSPVGQVSALHVDHGLRPESTEEARHAVKVCEVLDIDLEIHQLSLEGAPGNLSDRARIARYQALESSATTRQCEYVCTAHHAEDRFETMLQNLCRGGGAAGISKPRWVRSLGDVSLVRPLLGCARSDLRALCMRADLAFIDDPSNEDPASARGLLRQQVLPALEARWPGASLRASAAADRIAAASDALEVRITASFGDEDCHSWSRNIFRGVDVELSTAALRRSLLAFAEAVGVPVEKNSFARRLREAAEHASSNNQAPRTFEFAGGSIGVVSDVHHVRIIHNEC